MISTSRLKCANIVIFVATIVIGSCANDSENLLSRCETVRSLQVTDSGGHVLWRIEAVKPREICEIKYSQTPQEFRQVTPAVGLPRAFVLKERLTVERVTADSWCVPIVTQ